MVRPVKSAFRKALEGKPRRRATWGGEQTQPVTVEQENEKVEEEQQDAAPQPAAPATSPASTPYVPPQSSSSHKSEDTQKAPTTDWADLITTAIDPLNESWRGPSWDEAIYGETKESVADVIAMLNSLLVPPSNFTPTMVTNDEVEYGGTFHPDTYGVHLNPEHAGGSGIPLHELSHWIDFNLGREHPGVDAAIGNSRLERNIADLNTSVEPPARRSDAIGDTGWRSWAHLSPAEQFARAMEQYVSGVAQPEGGELGTRWKPDDFAPIAAALDQLFFANGMSQGTTYAEREHVPPPRMPWEYEDWDPNSQLRGGEQMPRTAPPVASSPYDTPQMTEAEWLQLLLEVSIANRNAYPARNPQEADFYQWGGGVG